MTVGDSFVWSGPASGSWDDTSNWTDSTTSTPAAAPPDADNPVTINSLGLYLTQTITGTGSSSHLTINGDTLLDGVFSTGGLTMGGGSDYARISVGAGDSLSVTGDETAGSAGGSLFVSGQFIVDGTFGGGSLDSQAAGKVQVGALSNAFASVDAGAAFEVGTAGGAKAGVFTVDAGATATSVSVNARTISNAGTITGGGLFYASEVDNTGSISGVNFHALDDNGITFKNSGTITLTGDWMPGAIVDNGLIVAAASTTGLESLIGDVTGTGQLQIASGGELSPGHVGAGITVAFTGSSGQLDLSSGSLDSAKTYDPQITGFAAGDVIDYFGKVTSVAYHSNGVLSLLNGSTVVAKLHLVGSYSTAAFHLTAFGSGTLISVGGGADTATSPAGTTTPDQYLWSGPTVGSWDAAANWTDTTTSSHPAAVAPGAHDLVTIESGQPSMPQVISGTGNSAQLTIDGDTLLTGKFSTGGLNVASEQTLTVQSKGSLSDSGDATGALAGTGGSITIAGTLTGAASASNGGKVLVGSLHGGGGVDATSSIEVGTKGTAKAGTFTVDAGATATLGGLTTRTVVNHGTMTNDGTSHPLIYTSTVTNTGSIYGVDFHELNDNGISFNNTGTITMTGDWLAGSVVDNGVIIAAASTTGLNNFVGEVTGNGQLRIANGADLSTGHVGFGVTVAFAGSSGSLEISSSSLDSAGAYDAKISGFASGDVINYGGVVTSAVYHQNNASLQLLNGSTVVAKLHLIGNYAGDTFHTTANGPFTSITVDPPPGHAALSGQIHDSFSFPESAGQQSPASDVISDVQLTGGGGGGPAPPPDFATHGGLFAQPNVLDAPDHGLLALAHHAPSVSDFFL